MTSLDEQLNAYLRDVHAIEKQALVQMRAAPKIAGDERIADIFREHTTETERHEQRVRERLEERGEKPSKIEDAIFAAGGEAFVLFARAQPGTPGKLISHALSYEHLEDASYVLLAHVAQLAGDEATVDVARANRAEELSMEERIESCFDRSVDASLEALDPDDLEQQLVKFLADAHALEAQAIQLLDRGPKIAGDETLARIYDEHAAESREHRRLVEQRLEAHGASPSAVKDGALRLGALNWGAFFQAQPDTPGKLAAFAHAYEHLEIGGYEQLKRVAVRAGDTDTVDVVERILADERAMGERVAAQLEHAVEVGLAAKDVPVGR